MTLRSQHGASTVLWLLTLLPFLGLFGALAVDLSNFYVAKAELQRAADAGALEGARLLFNPTNGRVNVSGYTDVNDNALPSAVAVATAAAQANWSQRDDAGNRIPVEVESVTRGHWQFLRNHKENGIERGGLFEERTNVTGTPPLTNSDGSFKTFQQLNDDTGDEEVNAVRVVVQRNATPVVAFLAGLLDTPPFQATAWAVAYRGFVGKILPGEVDWPLAMCHNNVDNGCDVGRLIPDTGDAGGWTDFDQPGGGTSGCSGAASANDVKDLITGCDGAINPIELILGWDVQTNNGQIDSVFARTFDCWSEANVRWGPIRAVGKLGELDTDGDGFPDRPWKWVLPVIDCTPKPGGRCNMLIGAVAVEVLWMLDDTTNLSKLDDDAPWSMARVGPDSSRITWNANASADVSDPTDGQQRWDSFVAAFNLQEPDGSPAQWGQKSIYYAPDCTPTDALGGIGGSNFGIRSNDPVLVY